MNNISTSGHGSAVNFAAPTSGTMLDFAWGNLCKINPSLPPKYSLTESHREQLAQSGITPMQACIAGIFSADAELARSLTGYGQSGLMFAYFDLNGKCYQWKTEDGSMKPFYRLRPDSTEGKAKYLSPKGSPVFVYVPRTTNYTWVGKDGGFKPGKKLVITEGEKKALCATLNDLPCFGLGGVSSFRTGVKPEKDSGEGRALGFFIDELSLLAQESVTIVYDSDIVQKLPVQQAIKAFGYAVAEAYKEKELAGGSSVINRTQKLSTILKYSLLPVLPDSKLGLDDAIVRFGAEPIAELLSSAMPLIDVVRAKADPADIAVTPLFSSEPLGDEAKKQSPKHLQAHNRSLIAWLCLYKSYAISPIACLKYCAHDGVWRAISGDEMANFPQHVADLNDWCNRGTGLMKELQSFLKKRLAVGAERFASTRMLGFLNGALNLDTMKFLPHSPENYLTQRLGFKYITEINCPNFTKWIFWTFAELLEDGSFDEEHQRCRDRIKLLQALLRWSLEPKESKAFEVEVLVYLIGMPGLGKGTFLELVRGLAGEAAGHWDLSTIGDPNSAAAICGKLIAIDSDLKGSLTAKTAKTINKIASNEPVGVKLLYQNVGDARLNTVLWAASNTSILSDMTDRQGIDRRVVYLEFKRTPEERDPQLKSRLLAELPGIFNWVWSMPLDEAVSTIKHYRNSGDYLEAQTRALLESNSIYQWIVDLSNPDVGCPVGINTRLDILYRTYTQWCSQVGSSPLGQRKFSAMLKRSGAEWKDNPYYSFKLPTPDKIDIQQMAGL
jgi:putative DNA primase/helicase